MACEPMLRPLLTCCSEPSYQWRCRYMAGGHSGLHRGLAVDSVGEQCSGRWAASESCGQSSSTTAPFFPFLFFSLFLLLELHPLRFLQDAEAHAFCAHVWARTMSSLLLFLPLVAGLAPLMNLSSCLLLLQVRRHLDLGALWYRKGGYTPCDFHAPNYSI